MLNTAAARRFLLNSLAITTGQADWMLRSLGYHGWFSLAILSQYVHNYKCGLTGLSYEENQP